MTEFRTATGLLVATNCTRIVYGGRGNYLEFEPEHMVMDHIIIPEDQEWRQRSPWKDQVFYDEFRTVDKAHVKVYYQRRYVSYADYNPGMYYVSVDDVICEGSAD